MACAHHISRLLLLGLAISSMQAGAAQTERPAADDAKSKQSGLYLSLRGGVNNLTDQLSEGPGLDVLTEYEIGYMASASIGHQFHPSAWIELEYSHRDSDADSFSTAEQDLFSGQATADALMVNVLFAGTPRSARAKRRQTAFPYFGLGVGAASVDQQTHVLLYDYLGDSAEIILDDVDTGFALQLIGGINWPVSNTLQFETDVRYMSVQGLSYDRITVNEAGNILNAGVFDTEYDTFNFTIGLKKHF